MQFENKKKSKNVQRKQRSKNMGRANFFCYNRAWNMKLNVSLNITISV